jgi:hypothetical protein
VYEFLVEKYYADKNATKNKPPKQVLVWFGGKKNEKLLKFFS